MKIVQIILVSLFGLGALNCCALAGELKPEIVVSVHPLKMILGPLVGEDFTLSELMQPGASPHTFEPKPSDLKRAQSALALYYVGPGLDAWAIKSAAKKKIQVLDLLPASVTRKFVDEDESPLPMTDPHFWTDPQTVQALLIPLTQSFCGLTNEACARIQNRAKTFSALLDRLSKEAQVLLSPLQTHAVILFHPSFLYLLSRMGIPVAGIIELSPGKEPSPKEIKRLIDRARALKGRVVFSEPQFSPRAAKVIAEALGIRSGVLEPYGSTSEISYESYFRSNLEALRRGLE